MIDLPQARYPRLALRVIGLLILSAGTAAAQPPPATSALLRKINDGLIRLPTLKDDRAATDATTKEISATLGQVAPDVPTIAIDPGGAAPFVAVTLNAGRAGFDAVRFRLPKLGIQYRCTLDVVVPGATEADSPVADLGFWLVDQSRYMGRRQRQSGPLTAPGINLPPAHTHEIVMLGPNESVSLDTEILAWFDLKTDEPTPAWLRLQIEPIQPTEPPTTAILQTARTTFQTGLVLLSERHDAEIKAIRRLYLTELDKIAQLPATKRDKAEANRIAAEVDRLNGGDAATESPKGLRIIRAEYGSEYRWMDVTMPLRSLIRGNILAFDPGDESKYGFKPDPDYGHVKALLIIYTSDGIPGVSMTMDSERVDLPRRPGTKR